LREESLVEELAIEDCQEGDAIEAGGESTADFWGFSEGGTSSDASIRCTA
jgi:hypothetical protein